MFDSFKRSNVKTFEHYISLGRSCEVAFQFRRVLGQDYSSFFSWNVTMQSSLLSLLSTDFSGIMTDLHFENGDDLVTDRSHNYQFHWIGEPSREAVQFDENKKEHLDKAQYLIDKFKSMLSSSDRKALFYLTEEENAKEFAMRLQSVLEEKYYARNCHIIIVQDKSEYEQDWCLRGVSNRYLTRIAPWTNAVDGDESSWNDIFHEFPHATMAKQTGLTPR